MSDDINVGQLSEAINNKADRDLGNTQPLARTVVEVSSRDILPSWWRVYSDGWCEQGALNNGSSTIVSLMKTYINTSYVINFMGINSNNLGAPRVVKTNSVTTSTFELTEQLSNGFYWQTAGYIS